ncbi:uncharacterized protein RJT21DRAFT_53410 [Scheffersomyces amazonensis]|uniref:uncharacterized protein n=1 Tax=Scheffersomyces amazonensis TaxID=1078765 RepID=UPI00315D1E79
MSNLARLQEIVTFSQDASPADILNEDNESEYSYYSDSEDGGDIDSEYQLSAQEHWEESIHQVRLLVNQIIFPLLGKVLGRRASHLIWKRVADWWFI